MKTMDALRFDNAFVRELPGDPEAGSRLRQVEGAAWSEVLPTPVAAPRLLAWTPDLAARLGFTEADIASAAFAEVFAGNRLLPGMQPSAANYGGHQFGQWAGQLGDGRAITLGELLDPGGQRWELQLKGAGPTPYSRHADGRAVLRSSIREFLCSEAMHHLGIPTTRALTLVGTGEDVVRDMFYDGHPRAEPGAIVCRAAPSFLRFGSFELPFARGDTGLLRTLADFCIRRDFPHLAGAGDSLYGDWFAEVCARTAILAGHWMRVGFVHGVLNTDNMSILGLTIDYGPYGWIEPWDLEWTPNITDASGKRYRFGNQPRVAHWNLAQLARALAPVADAAGLERALAVFPKVVTEHVRHTMLRKLGLVGRHDTMVIDDELLVGLQQVLSVVETDMTLFFRALAAAPTVESLAVAHYQELAPADRAVIETWLGHYRERCRLEQLDDTERRARMNAINPLYVPRNYLLQEVIDATEAGDREALPEILDVLRRPYEVQPGRERYAARRPEWARHKPGCSMLSCSS